MSSLVSVIFTVYYKTDWGLFDKSLNSIFVQRDKINDIIIVCDGYVSSELYEVVSKYKDYVIIKIISYDVNRGPGYARDFGIRKSDSKYVAIMDSDDISKHDRIETQLEYMESNESISVCGGLIEEIYNDGNVKVRNVPVDDCEIRHVIKTKSPINNVTAFIRKDDYIKVGGYPYTRSSEDYCLWGRFIANNKKLHNINKVMVTVTFDSDAIYRRSGWMHFKNDYITQRTLFESRIIGLNRFIINLFKYFSFRFLPKRFKLFLYDKVLRK
ncbi:glycosyltransferase [Vibrio cholerae]|nr:glycosyltransferase [Vibrio cholerae]